MAKYETARAINYQFGPAAMSNRVHVPAGLRCEPIEGEPGKFWVVDLSPFNAWDRHDASYYGIRLEAADVREVP